ncbi:hypothetical protein ACIQZB_43580 [Streptomyces sp. NPDC097727]|uniref:hypothetical protein n=1 Tax=Streptomyces sp. NPDC097727 TaxID=3366092 RepID=UPI00380E8E72
MITDMDQQRDKERQVLVLAQQVALLLNQIEDLGAGPVNAVSGAIAVPGARIRFINEWEVSR